jgi:hypothetical protein
MRNGNILQPHEIRVIKIEKSAIFDLLYDILGRIYHERIQTSSSTDTKGENCCEFYFDEEQYEIVLFEHRAVDRVNSQLLNLHIKDLAIVVIDSLYMFDDDISLLWNQGTVILHEEKGMATLKPSSNQNCRCQDPRPALTKHISSLGKNEVRIIRLSKQAIYELLWEYFMEFGNKVMDVGEENADDFPTIFRMCINGRLDELTLYLMSLDDASEAVFEKVDAYCNLNVQYTTNRVITHIKNRRPFVSILLSDIS